MKAAKYTALLILIAGWTIIVFCVGMEYEQLKPVPFPSIREWQVRLGVEDDGKLGPKTEAAWHNRYYEVHGYLMY